MFDNSKDGPEATGQVFDDPTGRRARRASLTVVVLVLATLAWLADYAYRMHDLAPPVAPASTVVRTAQQGPASLAGRDVTDVVMRQGAEPDCRQGLAQALREPSGVFAYVPYGDPTALSGLGARCSRLDAVIYQAFSFGGTSGAIRPLGPGAAEFPLPGFVSGWKARNRPAAYPILAPVGGLSTQALASLLGPDDKAFHDSLRNLALPHVDGGLCLDLSNYSDLPAEAIVPVLTALRARLWQAGLATCLIGRADAGFWRSEPLRALIDTAVAQVFRPPVAPSEPAAPQAWVSEQIAALRALFPPGKLHLAYATFADSWASGSRRPQRISFADAMLAAHVYHGQIRYSAALGTTAIRYLDENRRITQTWLPDAASFHNTRQLAGPNLPVVLWPIGYEDPSIWPMLDPSAAGTNARTLLETPPSLADHVVVEGSGPFTSVTLGATPGQRKVEISARTGLVTAQTYPQPPLPNRMRFFGEAGAPARLALTFRGIGDLSATDQLIEMLDKRGLKAVFFLSTRDLLGERRSVDRLIGAGQIVAAQVRPLQSRAPWTVILNQVANNITQHLLAYEHGYRPILVENPSPNGPLPGNRAALEQFRRMQADGYLPVHVDVAAPFGAFDPAQFLTRVRDAALARPANIVEFDFSPRNTHNTLQRLPGILDRLGAEGFDFVPVTRMAGLAPGAAMVRSTLTKSWADELTYRIMRTGWIGFQNIVMLLALIVALRSPIYLVLAFLRRERYPLDPEFAPAVAVIIPAFNEATVIERSVRSVLASDYPNFEVIVVDDGSTDNTGAIVVDKFRHDRRVSLWHEENHGKWFAENLGIGSASATIGIILDADTMIQPQAIRMLVQPFRDPRVGAVSGTVEIGNRDNFLTACQAVEYLYTQQVLRRAYEAVNGIIVVPGAIGAWRKEAVEAAGGVSSATITEDADLTVAVHRAGYRVVYQPRALSYTEAPTTVGALLRQRLRWTFGMFQVSWKHKRSITDGLPVGFISIIDAIWYGLITSLIRPFVDLIFVVGAGYWIYQFATEGLAHFNAFPYLASAAFVILAIVEFLNVLAAFHFAGRFDLKLFLMVPLLRFGYRQMLYIASIRSIWRAISGRAGHWNKLHRTGTAVMPTS